MRKMMDRLLQRYGRVAGVEHGGAVKTARILLQPSTSRSRQSMEQEAGPLGRIPWGQYLYIGPAGVPAEVGSQVRVGEKTYILRRAELVYEKDQPIYCWGLCVEKGGEDLWGC